MDRMKTTLTAMLVAAITLAAGAYLPGALAAIQLPPPEGITADGGQVKEIKAFYDGLEKAVTEKDLDKVMTFYADDYSHRGITRSQVRLLWKEIFADYDKLNSVHIFSNITALDTEALVVCTGTLLGIPLQSEEVSVVTIDRWANQNHFLSKVKGSWKIVGGATHWMTEVRSLPGNVIQHQLEFHPLY